jgi:hypothetical protein
MATFDFGGLLGSNMFGGGDMGLEEYLTPEQRSRMNQQGIMALAASLLKSSGPSAVPIGIGQALGEAYGAGQTGYQQAQTGAIANITARQKMDETKRALEMRKLYPTIFNQTDAGITIDPNKLQALTALSSNPLEALASVSKLVPDLRRAGFLTTGVQDNPFTIFSQDKTIPESLQRIASQYEKSYASGALDPDKVDERVRQLGQSIQTAQQYAQTAAGLEQQRTAMQGLTQQSLALRQQAEANKPETFSYSQKKEFDTLQKNIQAAKDAEDSAAIANRAASLVPQAFGSKTEAVVKGVLNAVTPMTFTAKDANDKLVQYGQQLALKTPKFSGPTSDADAKRYDTAVGDLANPSKSVESKTQALKDIRDLSIKQQDYAQQQENYYYGNNKSLKGFKYTPSNPFGK